MRGGRTDSQDLNSAQSLCCFFTSSDHPFHLHQDPLSHLTGLPSSCQYTQGIHFSLTRPLPPPSPMHQGLIFKRPFLVLSMEIPLDSCAVF